MKRMTLSVVVSVLLLGACGEREASVDAGGDGEHTTSTGDSAASGDVPAPQDVIEQLSRLIADSRHWASIRRVQPPDVGVTLGTHPGYIEGTVAGFQVLSSVPLPADEYPTDVTLRDDVTEEPVRGPVLVTGQIGLKVDVASFAGAAAETDLADRTVVVPIPVWSGGEEPVGRTAAVTAAFDAAAALPLEGTRVLVLVDSVDEVGGDLIADTAGSVTGGVPAAIVFVTSDGRLFSLDWLVGSEAAGYFGASTLDELKQRLVAS